MGRYVRPAGGVAFERERWELPDGDFVDVDTITFSAAPALDAKAPVGVLLHGLEGSARAPYVVETARHLARAGLRTIALNFRGCSGELNRLPRSYHSGDTDDARVVIRGLRERFGDVPMGAVGFSLGGNVLLKYLGEEGEGCVLTAAAAVSVPFDLGACARALSRGFSRIYSHHLLGCLQAKLRQRQALLDPHCDLGRGLAARDFVTFDDAVTAPLHGMSGAPEYYATCSSGVFLEHIRRPVALVQAVDDPFVPAESIPMHTVAHNAFLAPRFSGAGGHVGFVAGSPWRRRFWGDRTAAHFVARALRDVRPA